MCCFSGPVDRVSATNIFARSLEGGRQILVYSMTVAMKQDLAMVLPLPVPARSPEDALRFIDLQNYPTFFAALNSGFPKPVSRSLAKGEPPTVAAAPLPVVEVGDFEASFVPSEKDFERLDARFRLSTLPPAAKGCGFAVFKLKKGAKTVHPMAFDFPRANPEKLFFPTLHIHDGQVHPTADFDHALYAQAREGETHDFMAWQESTNNAARFVDMAKAKEVVDGDRHVYLREMRGRAKNEDVLA